MGGVLLGRRKLMGQFKERYVVDDSGKRVEVLVGVAEFEKILEELEELESIRAYDAAKAANDESIPLDQAFREIEQEETAP